jgi:L-ribulose-5-phosphate 3-epimerase
VQIFSRRQFCKTAVASLATASSATLAARRKTTTFPKLAVTSWSFYQPLLSGKIKATELPTIVKSLGIDTLEWTAKTFRDLKADRELMFQAPPAPFFHDLRRASDDAGVATGVVNVGGQFFLAGSEKASRDKAVDWMAQYVEPAQILGAKMMRAELYCDLPDGPDRARRAKRLAMEGLNALLDRTKDSGLMINVENHHGISSEPAWLAGLIKTMNHPRLGLTVDTNNNRIDDHNPYAVDKNALPRYTDRYRALEILMPHASWVSAKTYTFDNAGYEIALDYPRIMSIILKSGYAGTLSIEYEGNLEPAEGVRQSVAMFRKLEHHFTAIRNLHR